MTTAMRDPSALLDRLQRMSDPIHWDEARITWHAEDGYRLAIPISAGSRALALRGDQIITAIKDSMPGRAKIVKELTPMVIEEDASGARMEPGEIAIVTDTMITLQEAGILRNRLSAALEDSTEESERKEAEDDAGASAVLSFLRNPPE